MNFDIDILKQDGILKIDNFINVEPYIEEFDKSVAASTIDYPAGGFARIGRNKFTTIPSLSKIFQKEFRQIADKYLEAPVDFLLQIFLTHEHKILEKDSWARNQHLHFDPYHALKFMIFLTDVTKESGAFSCVPGTQDIGRKLRGRNPLEKNLHTGTYTLAAHSDYAHLADDVVWMEGSAGMLLIFDTDMIHGGGVLTEEGLERKVINAHCRRV